MVGVHFECDHSVLTYDYLTGLMGLASDDPRRLPLLMTLFAEFVNSSQGPEQVALGLTDDTLVRASKAGTFSGTGTDADTITVGSTQFVLKDTPASALHVQIGGSAAATAANFAEAVSTLCPEAYATVSGAVVTAHARALGKIGNLVNISESGTGFSWAGAATLLSGGTGFFKRFDVAER